MILTDQKNKKGFTLVEVLLYVGIISVLIFLMLGLVFMILQGKNKFQVISEVNEQGVQAIQIITQSIRNAESISVPASGATGPSLTLVMGDGGKNPTVINSDGNNLQIKEGTGVIAPLTNSRVVVSGLSFSNVSRTNTPGTVVIRFTISTASSSGQNEYNYAQNFYATASLR